MSRDEISTPLTEEDSDYLDEETKELLRERHDDLLSNRPVILQVERDLKVGRDLNIGSEKTTTEPGLLTRIFQKAKKLFRNGWLPLIATNAGWITVIVI